MDLSYHKCFLQLLNKNKEEHSMNKEICSIIDLTWTQGIFQQMASIFINFYNFELNSLLQEINSGKPSSQLKNLEEELQVQMFSVKNRFKLLVNKLIDDIWNHHKEKPENSELPSKFSKKKIYTSIVEKLQGSDKRKLKIPMNDPLSSTFQTPVKKFKLEEDAENVDLRGLTLKKDKRASSLKRDSPSMRGKDKKTKITKLLGSACDLDSEFLYNDNVSFKFGKSSKSFKF